MNNKSWQEKYQRWLETVPKELQEAHEHCRNNKAEIHKSIICGCFHCLKIYDPADIWEWISEPPLPSEPVTAMCPRCFIDAVLGSASGFPITIEFLKEMKFHWFDRETA